MQISLAATRWSRVPGEARMSEHYAGTVSQCKQTPGAGLGTRRKTDHIPLSLWVWAPEVPPGPVAD